MLAEARFSKKTFFAAAALAIVAVLPAQAYLFEGEEQWVVDNDWEVDNDRHLYRVDNDVAQSLRDSIAAAPGTWVTFVKEGSGTLEASSLGTFGILFNKHSHGYSHDEKNNDGAYYFQDRINGVIAGDINVNMGTATGSQILQSWSANGGGEIVVKGGRLNLTGYVNAWYDFGSVLNGAFTGQSAGMMTGASRITVRNDAELDLSGGNNSTGGSINMDGMVVTTSRTVFQFLNNLQAGDLGTDVNAKLSLGSSTALHLNLHVGSWNENTRIDTGVRPNQVLQTAYADSALAFGGSIGKISGNGDIYKTGAGTFTILSASAGFNGSLYAAGGTLTLAEDDSVGSTETFTDAFGNDVRVKISNGLGTAESVNIASTFNSGKEPNGGSMQGRAIGRNEHYQVVTVPDRDNPNRETIYTAVKESFFTPPSAGTLVIAENQMINNFQALFNAGYKVADGTSAGEAVLAAANNSGVLSGFKGNPAVGTSDAPVIAGTGIGSTLVIPGGNYTLSASGEYTINLDKDGYMQGGVLVINQSSGMGGIYQGSIVGARVSIYDKTQFDNNTSDNLTQDQADFGNATRLSDVLVREAQIKDALGKIYSGKTSDEINTLYTQLGVDRAGTFALDNDVAWNIVNFYKNPQLINGENHQFYIDYKANDNVKGGVLVLKGAGDLALLLDHANYSGIYIDKNRTGKTVLNIAAINALEGTTVSLGGRGIVAFVANQADTLKVKIDGFDRGSRLVFTTAELLNTVSGQIKVGDSRKATIGFAQTQETILGDVYVERGIELLLSGDQSTFTNASSFVLWKGATIIDDTIAAPSLIVSGKDGVYANQIVNNLTGDETSQISIVNGVLTTTVSTNALDGYSSLTRGVYNGYISGAGSFVKDGSATLTLGGGDLNRAFTGTMEVAKGALVVSKKNGLTGSGALILDSDTTVTMTGDQSLRTLYGNSKTSVSVSGTLTLGTNIRPDSGENRPFITNNLGTSVNPAGSMAASFARFQYCYDLEGNAVLVSHNVPTGTTQKNATTEYLEATAKLAYSGFDATTLKKFVGVKDYNGNELLSQSDYDALLEFAKNGGSKVDNVGGISRDHLLTGLAEKYESLVQRETYLKTFAKTATSNGWWSPAGLESLFSTRAEYLAYVASVLPAELEAQYGAAIPAKPTSAQKTAINEALFEVLSAKYNTLSEANLESQLLANPEKMFASFKTAQNLAGTALLSESQIAELDAYLKENKEDSAALLLAYNELQGRVDAIVNKKQFAGIAVPGAFASQVDASGNLLDTSWIDEPAFAGALSAPTFVKSGDSTVALTGTLATSKLIVSAGRLNLESTTLTGTTDGVSIFRGANLSINVAEGVDSKFGYAISGNGNFIKAGDGKLTLDKTAIYTGTTTIEGGTLQMSLRNPISSTDADGVVTTLAPQNNIFLTGNNVSLILDQEDEVSWGGSILTTAGRDNVSLEKIGDGSLTIRGEVRLGANSNLRVSEGELDLQGRFQYGSNSAISIAEGSALSLSQAERVDLGTVHLSGKGALRIAGDVAFVGASVPVVNPIPADGQGLSYDGFFGTVNVNTGTLSLSGNNSVFANARNVHLTQAGGLSIAGTSQTLRSLSGTGTITLENGASLQMNQSGERVVADYSSGDYVFNEEVLVNAPDFAGTLTGNGSVAIVGPGVTSFSGTVATGTRISVEGGQVVLSAENFAGHVSVNGTSKVYTDKNGNKLHNYAPNTDATNVSSGVSADKNGYLPRTVITSTGVEVNISGKEISQNEKNELIFTDDAGKEHVIASVKDWDYAEGDALSANWGIKDANGVFITDISSALTWNPDTQSYELNAEFTSDYKWLAEDAKGNLIVADTSKTNTLSSEVCFLVNSGETNLGSGSFSFTGTDGAFGKVGGGLLSVQGTDFANCGKITVYNGTLDINGWVATTKVIASGATLSMTIDSLDTPDFTTVYGSGTFELTADRDISISTQDGNSLPTFSEDGRYFNGKISFKRGASDYQVTLAGGGSSELLEMTSISTEEGVLLKVSNVKFNQSQNSEIGGGLEITGSVSVEGLTDASGSILSKDIRRMTVGDFSLAGSGDFALKNVGFGFNSTQNGVTVKIDKESIANTFFVALNSDASTLVTAGTDISLDINPAAGDTGALEELSFVKTGTATLTLSAEAISTLGSGVDSIFGIEESVYATLEKNEGVFNIGVEQGTLTLTGLGEDGTLTTATGTNVDLVTLRSSVAATAGSLNIANDTAQILAETIKGSGNVIFSGTELLTVVAAQAYTGQTTVSGNVEFSGDARYSKSSLVTVNAGGTLAGGVYLAGRDVAYSVIKARNADDTGAAGSTTLTVTLDDERLPAAIKCQIEIGSGNVLVSDSLTTLGALPEGVTVENATYEDGKLVLTLKDSAFGESYDVSINVDPKTFPKTPGSSGAETGTSTVAGNFTLKDDGKVVLDAAAGDGIFVGAGTATLEQGGKLAVENLNAETRGKTLVLVSAGTVTDGAGKTDVAAVVDALRAADDPSMKLMVFTDPVTGTISARMITDNFATATSGYNKGISGSFLDALSNIASWNGQSIVNADNLKSSDGKELFFALNSLTTAELTKEVDKLSPNAFASMLAMPVAAFNSDIARIHSRLDQRRYDGANPLRESGEYEFFALAQSDFAENGNGRNSAIFDYNLHGATAGFDWKPNYETTFGFALGYTYGKAKIHNDGGKINMDDMRVTAFASRLFGNFYLDAGAQVGMASFDTRRNTIAGRASGDTDSMFAGTFATLGSVFSLYQNKKNGSGLYFTPSVGLSYLHTSIKDFSESGTAGLAMDKADGDSLRARVAAGLQWSFLFSDWEVRLGVEAAYTHDFLGEDLDMEGRFAAGGPRFKTSGKALPTDIFSFGPTIDVMVSERSSLYFGYGIDVDTDSGISQNVNAGFRHRF